MGPDYLMTVAKEMNCEYEFYDEDHHSRFFRMEDILEKLCPDIVAISCMTPQYHHVRQIVGYFRKEIPRLLIVMGGPHPSALPRLTLEELPDVDIICKGEKEKTFEEILMYVAGKVDIGTIKGIFYQGKGEIIENGPRELAPASELEEYAVDLDKIYEHGPYVQKISYKDRVVPVFPILTTRECPYKCIFCDEENIWNRRIRSISLDKRVEEIHFLKKDYGATFFNILDDTFTIKNPGFWNSASR